MQLQQQGHVPRIHDARIRRRGEERELRLLVQKSHSSRLLRMANRRELIPANIDHSLTGKREREALERFRDRGGLEAVGPTVQLKES